MALQFEEIHAASDAKKINEEWFVLTNAGGTSVSTAGLSVIVSRPGKRGSILGQIDPGFLLQPGEKILVVSGKPSKGDLESCWELGATVAAQLME